MIKNIPKNFLDFSVKNYPVGNNSKNFEGFFYDYYFSRNIVSDYNYIPIQWTNYLINNDYGKNLDELNLFLSKYLDKNKKYFTIVQYAGGPLVKLKNTLIFSLGGTFNTNIPKNSRVIPLPLIYQTNKKPIDISKKSIHGSYIGRPTHPLRLKLEKVLSKEKDFYIKNLKSMKSEISVSNQNLFKEIMGRSYFSICPRGFGPTSFRLYESILNGVVPVYISNLHFLPYEEVIDWKNFSIILKPRSIKKIPKLLKKKVENGDYQVMKENLDKVKDTYFNFDFMARYIEKKIS